MTRLSVRVSFFGLALVAAVLILIMNWVGHQVRQSTGDQTLKVVEDWPTTLPEEDRRVFSLDGLSIIRPSGWHASISEDSIQLIAPSTPPGYLEPSEIEVKKVHDRYRHPRPLPETSPYKDGHACLQILHVQTTNLDPISHEARIVVKHKDDLYEVIFRSHKHFSKRVPDRIWQYLETFEKFEEESLTASLE